MNKQKVYNYVMNTPHNTNPNVLSSLLNEPVSWNDLADKPFSDETKVETIEHTIQFRKTQYHCEGQVDDLLVASAITNGTSSSTLITDLGELSLVDTGISEGSGSRYYDIINKQTGEKLTNFSLLIEKSDEVPTGRMFFYFPLDYKYGNAILSTIIIQGNIKTIDPKFLPPIGTENIILFKQELTGDEPATWPDRSKITAEQAKEIYTKWVNGTARVVLDTNDGLIWGEAHGIYQVVSMYRIAQDSSGERWSVDCIVITGGGYRSFRLCKDYIYE